MMFQEWWSTETSGCVAQRQEQMAWDPCQASVSHEDHIRARAMVAMVDNSNRCVEVGGLVPSRVLIDSGAKPVILGRQVRVALGLSGDRLKECNMRLTTAAGTKELVFGITRRPMCIVFNAKTPDECEVWTQCVVTNADNYDVLLGADATFKPGMGYDLYAEVAFYKPGWARGDYARMTTISIKIRKESEGCFGGACVATWSDPGQPVADDPLLWCVQAAAELWLDELGDWEEDKAACQVIIEKNMKPDAVLDLEGYWPKKLCDAPTLAVEQKPDLQSGLVTWNPGEEGITMLELFSGIGVGLEAVLKADIRVKRYVCVETGWQAQAVARERVVQMQKRFP